MSKAQAINEKASPENKALQILYVARQGFQEALNKLDDTIEKAEIIARM